MPPDPPREQGPQGLATPTQINTTPTSKTVENPDYCLMTDCYLQLFLDQQQYKKKFLGRVQTVRSQRGRRLSSQGKNNFVTKLPTKLNLRQLTTLETRKKQ